MWSGFADVTAPNPEERRATYSPPCSGAGGAPPSGDLSPGIPSVGPKQGYRLLVVGFQPDILHHQGQFLSIFCNAARAGGVSNMGSMSCALIRNRQSVVTGKGVSGLVD